MIKLKEGGLNDPAEDPQGHPFQGYVVQPGDCMESIAFEHGFLWQSSWELPENAGLKRQREPNVLWPGDRVFIPPLRPREESRPTDQLHRFTRLGVTCQLQLRFLDEKLQPRSGVAYLLTIDGKTTKGQLDGDGSLRAPIPPNAKNGKIELDTDPDPESYDLDLGHLDPIDTPDGLRARLNNLGFGCAVSGAWDEDLRNALKRYQVDRNLETTGELDAATLQALKDDHQS